VMERAYRLSFLVGFLILLNARRRVHQTGMSTGSPSSLSVPGTKPISNLFRNPRDVSNRAAGAFPEVRMIR
jgi:hypothetical protein